MSGSAGDAPRAGDPSGAEALAVFERERGRLFGIAYRMLGSARDAEDVLQEAYIRWHRADRSAVEDPAAFLVRVVTRLSIDAARMAHRRRVEYVGPWLPEPLVEAAAERPADDPEGLQELADDLSIAFLLMLERLTPVERAVFLLRESFDFGYREIAEVVGKTEENCRQIERRARQRLADAGRSRPASPEEHDRLLERFLLATREGDLDGLLELLAEDAVAVSDGGGRVSAARKPVRGARNVARFLAGLRAKAPEGVELRLARVNGRTGVLVLLHGRPLNVVAVEVEAGRIASLYLVVNPEKLPGGTEHFSE